MIPDGYSDLVAEYPWYPCRVSTGKRRCWSRNEHNNFCSSEDIISITLLLLRTCMTFLGAKWLIKITLSIRPSVCPIYSSYISLSANQSTENFSLFLIRSVFGPNAFRRSFARMVDRLVWSVIISEHLFKTNLLYCVWALADAVVSRGVVVVHEVGRVLVGPGPAGQLE